MRNDWTEKLSEYLDGEMSAHERAELEARLEEDTELRTVLEELRAVKAKAGAMSESPPAIDLWPGIVARISGEGDGVREVPAAGPMLDLQEGRRRFSFTVPQLAAASLALVLLGSGAVWLGAGFTSSERLVTASSPAPPPAAGLVSMQGDARPSYEAAIQDLETRLREGRDRLDPTTVEILERSLETIDRAILQAREAVAADPANVYLNRHLADEITRKLRLLRRANALAVVGT
jgi:hypothetical protein